jgi:hypothetical protein
VFRYPERFDSGLEAKAFAFLSVDPSIIPPLVGLNVLQPNDGGGWSVMKARTMRAFLGCYLLQILAHFRFRYNIIIKHMPSYLATYLCKFLLLMGLR